MRRATAVREFRPLTSNEYCGRSDRRILLKLEPLGSYRKEFPMNIRELNLNGWILNYVQINFENGRYERSSTTPEKNFGSV